MSESAKITRNASILLVSEIVSKLLSFLILIMLARMLGDVELGKYSFIFAFFGIFSILSDFGISTLMIRDIAKKKSLAEKYFNNIFTFKLILAVVTVIIPIAIIWITHESADLRQGMLLGGLSTFFFYMSSPFRSMLIANEKQHYHAFFYLIERTVAFCFGIYVLATGYPLISFLWVLVLSNFVSLAYIWNICSRKFLSIRPEMDLQFIAKLVKESLPFWMTSVFMALYFRIDTVMLTYMAGFQATGLYNAAYKVIDTLSAIPYILIIAIYPVMSRLHQKNNAMLQQLFSRSIKYLLILSVPLAIGGAMVAESLIIVFFGAEFTESVIILKILIWSVLFIFANYVTGYLLNSIHKEHFFTICTGAGALLNIILNYLLIPRFSYSGAAAATLFTEFVIFILMIYYTRKSGFSSDFTQNAWKPLIAGAGMAVVLFFLQGSSLFLILPAAGGAYFAILILIGGISRDEFSLLKNAFSSISGKQ